MATNHNINVNLNQHGSSSTLKTSAKGSVSRVKGNASRNANIPQFLKKANAHLGGVPLAKNLKYAGVAGAIGYAVVGSANKALDIYFDIKSASTGDVVSVGNMRRTKNYVLNPVKYFVDDIYNYGLLQQRVINRQNRENDYYRELTGKAIVGNQYGSKR